MFGNWLTLAEKDAFIAELESQGYDFYDNPKTTFYTGTMMTMIRIKKHPKNMDDFAKKWWIKMGVHPIYNTYKLELYDMNQDVIMKKKVRKEKDKKIKEEKEKKDKKPK